MRALQAACAAVVFAVAALSSTTASATDCLSGRAGRSTAQGAFFGTLLGAAIGAMTGNNSNRGNHAATGAAIGAVVGGAAGCWTAHEQDVAAAREDRIDARISQLEERTDNLRKYNAELSRKIADLRSDLAGARRSEANAEGTDDDIRDRLRAEQRHARDQLETLQGALDHVADMTRRLDPADGDYRRRSAVLAQERLELLAARDKLEDIVAMQA